ncbi:hypothetical protein [Aeromicrobium sp. Leaf291]|uniref:hypothetical protein n=1 Tax=Aeromicrobium sp. Leaf291 TaxID=1736325 RepID=UPI0012E1B04E|nr:hypothetical protein [Aeromicrobium sp. Leaf291]
MANWRGPRSSGGTTGRTGAAARVRQQPWSDPRLVLGVLLVLGATVLGAYVVAAGDDTEPYWALSRDVAAGDPVERSDLVESRARLGERAAGAFLRTDQELPADLASLRWARAGRGGALVERSAMARDGAGGATELPLSVRLGAAPDDLRIGDRVDVWVGPSPEDGAEAGEAALALTDVPVVRNGAVVGAGGTRTVLVDVAGLDLDGEIVAALTARHVTIVRRA